MSKITKEIHVLNFHLSRHKQAKTYVNRLKQSWNPKEIPGRGGEEKIHTLPPHLISLRRHCVHAYIHVHKYHCLLYRKKGSGTHYHTRITYRCKIYTNKQSLEVTMRDIYIHILHRLHKSMYIMSLSWTIRSNQKVECRSRTRRRFCRSSAILNPRDPREKWRQRYERK